LKHSHRILTLIIVLVLLVGCLRDPGQRTSDARNRIVYGLTLNVSGIDPHINQSATMGIVLRQIYDTLVYRDPTTDEFVSGLAESWSLSEDGLSYTFQLRQGVTFHDGTPLNAQAVAANLDRIVNLGAESQRALVLLGPYAGYEIIDEYTLVVRLTEPYSPFLDSLAQPFLSIASPTAFGQYDNLTYQYHQVGTGPFRMVSYVPGDSVIIERSPDYRWGPSFYNAPVENSIDEIAFRFFEDGATRAQALQNGDADIMGELLPLDARELTGSAEVQLYPILIPGQPIQFVINTSRPPTDRLELRQALLLATNRSIIVDAVYQGFSPIAWGPLSEVTPFYSNAVAGTYSLNTGQAQSLLTAMGYTDADGNGYLDAFDGDLTVSLIVPGWNFVPETAQLIQDQWRAIGVRAELNRVPGFSGMMDLVQAGDFNMVAFYQGGSDPSLLNPFFQSDSSRNWTGFGTTELDNILIQAAQISDAPTRANLYAQAQAIIMNEVLILPITDLVVLNGARARVQGLTFDAYGWYPLLNNVTLADE
jgi:peptide/nickel transport system substrate-binding protein